MKIINKIKLLSVVVAVSTVGIAQAVDITGAEIGRAHV